MYRFNSNVTHVSLPSIFDTQISNHVITDYRIRSLAYLDRGAFGEVYRITQANQPETVLKVIAARDSSVEACREMLAEARNEAEIVECLEHPSIIKLIQHKAYPCPFQPRMAGYYTMQFEMCHTSLHSFILEKQQNGTLGNRFIIENLLQQIGSALKHMHEMNFVHHDIKPGNIMVVNNTVPMENLHFKLIDFGVAQSYNPDVPLESTPERLFAGTEWYMCHEKFAMHPSNTGPVVPYNPYLADVFALGVTCLECALGFEEEMPNDSRDDALLRMFARFSTASHLSEPVRLSLLKMLWKNEKDRSHMHEILR